MKKSTTPTSYMLIKARNGGNVDAIDFALVRLTEAWKAVLAQRLLTMRAFDVDETFHSLSYWEAPMGFYSNPKDFYFTDEVMEADEDWAFVTLDAGEERTFPVPVAALEWHQFVVTNHGLANFMALSVSTHEEYWTEWFSIGELLDKLQAQA